MRLGKSFNPVHSIKVSVRSKREEQRAREREQEEALKEQEEQTKKLKEEALNKYKSGVIDPGRKAAIDKQASIREAQARESLAKAGISEGTTAIQTKDFMEKMRVSELDAARDEEFTRAMKLIGVDDAAISSLIGIRTADRAALGQQYAAVMQSMSTVGAIETDIAGEGEE